MTHKTESCLWCGLSEAMGAKLKQKCNAFGGRVKYECVDSKVCDQRIKSLYLGWGKW